MVEEIKSLKDKVGSEKFEEIVEKEWKTADLPSEEELAAEKHKSPKARNHPNSRKNLIQYRKDKPKRAKKAALKNLEYTNVEEDLDPKEVLDSKIDIDLINKLLPANDILVSRKEQELYWNTINLFLGDFDFEELSASDIGDVIDLAVNKVLEYRLLQSSAANPKYVLDVSTALERFRKHSEKLKAGLASRRIDRVDVKNKVSLSIVDLAVAVDEEKEREWQARINELEKEEKKYLADRYGEEDQ
jgi:hypothetical protein